MTRWGTFRSRRFAAVTLAAVCLMLLTGCPVSSLNGLSESGDNDADMVLDSRLLGIWSVAGEKCTSMMTITAREKLYDLQFADCEKDNKKSYSEARLFKLDQHYFLDVTPRSDDVCDMCIGIHWISLVQFDKDSFSLAPIDFEWFNREVEKRRVKLATLPDEPSRVTASAKELKAFCRKYADNREAFKPDPEQVFRRQQSAN
jgi:hypothetical protein